MSEPDDDTPLCDRCGQVHERCGSHVWDPDQEVERPCRMHPKRGARVCRKHGGAAPQVQRAAELRARMMDAQAAVVTYGARVDIDPGTALLEEVCRTAGHVQWLERVIHVMDPDALVWGLKTETYAEGRSADGRVDLLTQAAGSGVNAYLDLYHRERDLLRRVCTDALKAGIQERKVQLAEQAGEGLGQWVQVALQPLGLTESQVRSVLAEGARNLHLLRGGLSA